MCAAAARSASPRRTAPTPPAAGRGRGTRRTRSCSAGGHHDRTRAHRAYDRAYHAQGRGRRVRIRRQDPAPPVKEIRLRGREARILAARHRVPTHEPREPCARRASAQIPRLTLPTSVSVAPGRAARAACVQQAAVGPRRGRQHSRRPRPPPREEPIAPPPAMARAAEGLAQDARAGRARSRDTRRRSAARQRSARPARGPRSPPWASSCRRPQDPPRTSGSRRIEELLRARDQHGVDRGRPGQGQGQREHPQPRHREQRRGSQASSTKGRAVTRARVRRQGRDHHGAQAAAARGSGRTAGPGAASGNRIDA